eukprot:464468-Hanusia_phi.AAC.1
MFKKWAVQQKIIVSAGDRDEGEQTVAKDAVRPEKTSKSHATSGKKALICVVPSAVGLSIVGDEM